MPWFHLALVIGLVGVTAVAVRRLYRASDRAHTSIEVGNVSESWLLEQRDGKNDRLTP